MNLFFYNCIPCYVRNKKKKNKYLTSIYIYDNIKVDKLKEGIIMEYIIYRKYRYGGGREELARGSTLKEACLNWYNNRNNNDDLWSEFAKSRFCGELEKDYSNENEQIVELEEDYSNEDEQTEAFDNFISELTGEEMFDIMRDGTYNYYMTTDDDEDEED